MRELVSKQIKMVAEKELLSNVPVMDPSVDPWIWSDVKQNNGNNAVYNMYNHSSTSTHKWYCWHKNGIPHLQHNVKSKHPESGKYTTHWIWKQERWYNQYSSSDIRTGSSTKNPADFNSDNWNHIHAKDWCMLFNSLLLLRYDKYFCTDFSAEVVELQTRQNVTTRFSNVKWDLPSGFVAPTGGLSDPNHFGSLAYSYCEFKNNIEK